MLFGTLVRSSTTLPRPRHVGHAHLVGIAGAGMRSLATVLEGRAWRITGSDACQAADLPASWEVAGGHSFEHLLSMPEIVVHSPAVPADNAELTAARRLGIPVVSYPAMLGRLMQDRIGIAVAGTHGKSTTTAMTAAILRAAGLDPTVVVGAEGISGPVSRHGNGPFMLVEACEYQSSFLHLQPSIAAILNIEPDHFDYFTSAAHLEAEFAKFATRLPADGVLIAREDCAATMRIVTQVQAQSETFGFSRESNWRATDLESLGGYYRFGIIHNGRQLGPVRLAVAGRHQVLNALAAAAIAHKAGAGSAEIIAGLQAFTGLRRRLETLGTAGGVTVIDDYAHHPTEISATLSAVREIHPNARICCVFEPHQAGRTKSLLDELASSLQNADTLAIADIFRAREPAWQPGEVTAAHLADRAGRRGATVAAVHEMAEIEDWLFSRWRSGSLAEGDVIVTLGAGKIGNLANGIYQRIRKNSSAK